MEGRHFTLRFDGIFRSADIWVNGFWLGHEPSGYATQVYDISEYLNYGGGNLVAVTVETTVRNSGLKEAGYTLRHTLRDAAGAVVASATTPSETGFPKDEAWYLKAWWTDEPVLHIFPHWNLQGHEGEAISLWVYSNCDEVELSVNGKRLGRKKMPVDGYLSWDAVYRPGKVKAVGYKNGRRILTETLETTGAPAKVRLSADRTVLKADGADVTVVTLQLEDAKGRFVPDACNELSIKVDGPVRILGVGNGDSAWQASERPKDPDARSFQVKTFNGLAQVLLQSASTPGPASLTVSGTLLSLDVK